MLPTELLKKELDRFIQSPFPLWETPLTAQLVKATYDQLEAVDIKDRLSYTTATALIKKPITADKQFLVSHGQKTLYLESPNTAELGSFYNDHDLTPLTKRELLKKKAATKLKAALSLLATIPDCIDCVSSLVNCIQVIASEGPDYDTSYSHPELPFTIFVSVCDDDDHTSSFRVAEGILHEAMHLKLSLIERHIRLVVPHSTDTFYSPWRNVQRPLMGVLHGLFVFRAVYDFCQVIKDNPNEKFGGRNSVAYRMADINTDFQALNNFSQSHGLTAIGRKLADQLQRLDFVY